MVADAREQRGRVIAAERKVVRRGDVWIVPSQSDSEDKYAVRIDAESARCTCPDHERRRVKCRHIFAVEYVIRREQHPDGSATVTPTLTVTETIQRTTYPQNWTAYNTAQSVEKDRFQERLADLCRGIPEPERTGTGRKPHRASDAISSMVPKVYSTFSARRFSPDLREAHARGHLSRPLPGLKVPQFFENADYAPLLKQLIVASSLPPRTVESAFAIDSSGFGSSKFVEWLDESTAPRVRKWHGSSATPRAASVPTS